MGFLTVKTETYTWEESVSLQQQIKQHGLTQLINLWNSHKAVQKPLEALKWGDEVEYHVFSLNNEEKLA